MKNLIIEETKLVGNNGKHLKLFLRSSDGTPKIFEAIGFNMTGQFQDLKKGDKVDAVFNLEQDEWNGSKKIQLKLVDLRLAK
jgi:single-stranded-DNA-specific exonuclease